MSKQNNKPEWLIKAEQERDKFNDTKYAKVSDTQLDKINNTILNFKLNDSIEQSKKVSLDKFIFALGIRHIGTENAKLIS